MANLAPELVIDADVQAQVDGSNTTFTSRYAFIPGTVTFYRNGQALVHGKGILETGTNTVVLEQDVHGRTLPPKITDNVWLSYMA